MIADLDDSATTKDKYGPWAVVAGSSDGTGEAFAREVASRGLNVLLVARREEILNALADELRAKHGVETRVLAQDLMAPDAAANMLNASADLDVGLYISNAGVDGQGAKFFDEPVERWKRFAQMNVITLLEAIHGFGNRLRERGRGGILIMGSLTSLGGVPYLAMYSSTKAFKMSLCEAVWGELLAFNVDVSNVVAPLMNTPMYQNKIKDEDFAMGDAMLYECDDIARIALSKLGKQPLIVFPSDESMDPTLIEEPRYQALVQTMESAKTFFPRGQKITN